MADTKSASDLLTGLEKVPNSDDQLLADYVELRCLISRDGEYAFSDLIGAMRRQRDLGRPVAIDVAAAVRLASDGEDPTSALGAEEIEIPAPEGDQPAREAAADAGPDDQLPEDSDDSESDISENAQLDQLQKLLQRRERAFGADYPFSLSGNGALKLAPNLSDGQRLYLFLLTASCYRNVKGGKDRKKLTNGFERLAVPVLRRYFGDRLEAHVFGTAAKKGERYYGGLKRAIKQLSADTGFDLGDKWKRHKKEISDSGDRGLDAVGWIPFDSSDPADLRFIIFAQCGTGKNWEDKQFDAAAARWERVLHRTGPLTTALLISFSWRGTGGDWYKTLNLVTENLVFDRERIIKLLSGRSIDDIPQRYVNALLAVEDADSM